MTNRPGLDPNHDAKRSTLNGTGVLLLVIGAPCALIGFCFFMSVFFTADSGSFQSNESHGAIGMVLMIVGGPLTIVGLSLLNFANFGKIARYQAGEIVPVARDVITDVSPVVTQVTRNVARAVREGLSDDDSSAHQKLRHSCGTLNDPTDAFCKGCGQPLAEKICAHCQTPNDLDATFCKQCGTKLA